MSGEFPEVVLISGATGLVGTALIQKMAHEYPNTTIRILSRHGKKINRIGRIAVDGFAWNPVQGTIDPRAVDGVQCIVHLAGETVAQRWSPNIKRSIRTSRIDSLFLLKTVCEAQGIAPRIVSASAIGWYASSAENQNESNPHGTGFISEVVRDWEAAAADFGDMGGGCVSLRIGLVLAKHGGIIAKLAPLYRWGLGSPLAPGTQWQSWIHIDDLVHLFLRSIERRDWNGAFNAVSPKPIQQRAFSEVLARVLNRAHFLPPVPAVLIRLFYGEAARALLASHRIIPERITASGFQFKHIELDTALREILH